MGHSRIRRYLRHGTLPQLAVFEASARLASFTGASRELHLAQPTVSAQIRKLGETLGARLFAQTGKQIHLTEAGRRLYARCADLFGVLEELERDLAAVREVAAGTLRIATGSAGEMLVARLLGQFTQRNPGVAATLHIASHPAIAQRMASDEDDLYLATHPTDDGSLVRQAVAANPYVVLAAAADPIGRERGLTFARIAERAFVMRERGSATRAVAERVFADHATRPMIRMTVSTHCAAREAVRAGCGLAILPQRSFGFADDTQGIAELDVVGFPLPCTWQFVYPVGRALTGPAQAFLDLVRAETFRLRDPGARTAVEAPGPSVRTLARRATTGRAVRAMAGGGR